MVVEKKVMKRRSAPDADAAPKKAVGPVKKAAPRAAAPPRPPSDDAADEEEVHLRSGWSAAQETIDATSPWAANFVPTTKMQIVKFLQGSPYASYRRHWVQRVGTGNRPYVCLESVGRPCPICGVGDRAQAVAAFNIAVLGDDPDEPGGGAVHKSWDCAVKVTQILKTFAQDPKIGPLERDSIYFGVSVTESQRRGQQKQTMVVPIRARDMEEDYKILPLDEDTLERLMRKLYTNDIVQIPRSSELEEIAAEMVGMDEDTPAGSGWS